MTTNLLGPVRVSAAFVEHLKRQPDATIINNSSVLAFIPIGLYLKLSHFASHPSGLAGTQALIVCGLIQGLGATLAGAWAWSIATRRLPLALSGQLIDTKSARRITSSRLEWPSWRSVRSRQAATSAPLV